MTRMRLPLYLLLPLALLLSACGDAGRATELEATTAPAATAVALLPTPTVALPPVSATTAAPDARATKTPPPAVKATAALDNLGATDTPTPTPAATATSSSPTPDAAVTQQFSWSGGYSFWPPGGL